MGTQTSKLKLEKPSSGDLVDIHALNFNSDQLDAWAKRANVDLLEPARDVLGSGWTAVPSKPLIEQTSGIPPTNFNSSASLFYKIIGKTLFGRLVVTGNATVVGSKGNLVYSLKDIGIPLLRDQVAGGGVLYDLYENGNLVLITGGATVYKYTGKIIASKYGVGSDDLLLLRIIAYEDTKGSNMTDYFLRSGPVYSTVGTDPFYLSGTFQAELA